MKYPPITYKLLVEKSGDTNGICQSALLRNCGLSGILTKEMGIELYSEFYWRYMSWGLLNESDHRIYALKDDEHNDNRIEAATDFFNIYEPGKLSKVDKIVAQAYQ